ncbi:hypothetical protein B0H12DRAFT_1241133 [Mycena haematopus]|nr:hypothetical protein B0H12DRAFT_1241133 [Mycena haematopus]
MSTLSRVISPWLQALWRLMRALFGRHPVGDLEGGTLVPVVTKIPAKKGEIVKGPIPTFKPDLCGVLALVLSSMAVESRYGKCVIVLASRDFLRWRRGYDYHWDHHGGRELAGLDGNGRVGRKAAPSPRILVVLPSGSLQIHPGFTGRHRAGPVLSTRRLCVDESKPVDTLTKKPLANSMVKLHKPTVTG